MPSASSRDKYGLFFDAALYGSPRMATELSGGRQLYQKRFGPNGEWAAYSALELDAIGAKVKTSVGTRFAQAHGRTGATVASMQTYGRWSDTSGKLADLGMTGGGLRYLYTIKMEGHVGFVIDALPTHTIESPQGLANNMTGPWEGRYKNFYDVFEPDWPDTKLLQVTWQQGKNQSYSPDRSWYMDDPTAEQEAIGALKRLAARAVLLWGNDAEGLTQLPLKMPTTTTFTPGSPFPS